MFCVRETKSTSHAISVSVRKRCTLSKSGLALVYAGVVYADVNLQDLHWQEQVIENSRACFRLDLEHESKNEVRLFSRHLPIIHYPPRTHSQQQDHPH